MYSENTNLWADLVNNSNLSRMRDGGLLGVGRIIDPDSKKIRKNAAIDPDVPWIYVNPNPELFCMEFRAIFEGFGFICGPCLDCWKIVIAPNTFHQLIQLLDLEEEIIKEHPDYWCKCGIEKRNFVPRNYGGYFYTRSEKEGQDRKKFITELVHRRISPKVNVSLKRYCTEFELSLGPSDKYKRPDTCEQREKDIWKDIEIQVGAIRQPQFVRDHVIKQWMIFAWGRGDMTVMKYNNGQPLFRPSVTY